MINELEIIEQFDTLIKIKAYDRLRLAIWECTNKNGDCIDFLENFFEKWINRGKSQNVIEALENLMFYYPIPNLMIILAEAQEKMGNYKNSISTYQKILNITGSNSSIFYQIGRLYYENKDYQSAEIYLLKAIKTNYLFTEAIYLLASCYRYLENYNQSLTYFKHYLKIDSQNANVFYNIAVIYEQLSEWDKSLHYLDYALSINPNFVEAHWNKALILLRLQIFDKAWKEFEWRKMRKEFLSKKIDLPELIDFENSQDKSVLVYTEQGLGDSLQFLRFVPNIKDKFQKIGVLCEENLKSIFQKSQFFDEIFVTNEQNDFSKYHLKLSLLSLPFLLDVSHKVQEIPIFEQNQRIPGKIIKVGICWRGNSEHLNDKNRSIAIENFLEMLPQEKNFQFYNLQYGELSESEIANLNKIKAINLMQNSPDFENSLQIISSLDLVVSVDTAILHLSGNMGIKTLVPISAKSDWRWGISGKSTIWYNSVELFRQTKLGVWDDVFEKIRNRIKILAYSLENKRIAVEFLRNGDFANSIPHLEEYLANFPEDVSSANNLAIALVNQNQKEKAVQIFHHILDFNIKYEKAYLGLSDLYFSEDNFSKTEEVLESGIYQIPNSLELKKSLAYLYFVTNRLSQSKEIYLNLKEKFPENAEILYNLGVLSQEEKDFEKAKFYLNNAILLNENPKYHYALSEILLTEKQYEVGLSEFENRIKFMKFTFLPKIPTKWNEIENKEIAIYEEQGIGDTFNLLRFAIETKKIAQKVFFVCRDELVDFFRQTKLFDAVFTFAESEKMKFDFSIPNFSLFPLFWKEFKEIPPVYELPNLFQIEKTNRFGVAWRGNPFPHHNRKRHLKLEELEILFQTENEFVVLQNDLTEHELQILSNYKNVHLRENPSFENLVKSIYSSQKIITIDSLFLHVAGSFNIPTQALIPFSADWRWGIDEKKSIWYNSVWLNRQNSDRNWKSTIEEIIRKLQDE